jgi:hypothetical protein
VISRLAIASGSIAPAAEHRPPRLIDNDLGGL